MLNPVPTLMTPSAAAPQAAPSTARGEPASDTKENQPAFARQLQDAQAGEAQAPTQTKAAAEATKPGANKNSQKPSKVALGPGEAEASQEALRQQGEAARLLLLQAGASVSPDEAQAEAADAGAAALNPSGSEANAQVLGALLAQLRVPTPPATAPGTDAVAVAADELGEAALAGSALQAGRLPAKAEADRRAQLLSISDQSLAATHQAGKLQEGLGAALLEQQTQQDSPNSHDTAGTGLLGDAAAAAATALAAPATPFATQLARHNMATTQAQLSAPLGSPEFAPQLGAQITTFVRDGIQHAELHLNPAEMGPVSVQIQLDGQGARVHLMADQANTRQALEQALPQLAGSLREAGLTLTGGGVFQQPRQGGGEGREDGSGRGGRSRNGVQALGSADNGQSDGNARSAGQSASRQRGVVDLIA